MAATVCPIPGATQAEVEQCPEMTRGKITPKHGVERHHGRVVTKRQQPPPATAAGDMHQRCRTAGCRWRRSFLALFQSPLWTSAD
ncbi:hypothetical protein CWR43_32140 [Rhizobium sullae]|uniref:Uncharacterized protein n=1 Tax=Rhizobium sullae TaxID=50338 RepID=A0A2N0D0G0_RHISU|nr:hypothetical protein CWR43_32140 [Rhizobium sullae]